MKIDEFKEFIDGKYIFLDGATGSNLVKCGFNNSDCPELWIMNHPEAVIKLQKAYVEAGSNIVYAPTFTANRIKLKEYGLEDRIEEINVSLVELSKKAVKDRALVAGDITMTGLSLKPTGPLDFEELVDIYKEQIRILDKAGCDLLTVETMMSLQETRAALIAAKEVSELPVICTLTFEGDGRTLYGTDAKTAAIVLESLGAAAIGANCSTGPDKMLEIIKDMVSVSNVPIIAKPNAGMPMLDDNGNTIYGMNEEEFANGCVMLAEAGASVMGGCCGTSPSYIKALTSKLKDKKPSIHKRPKGVSYVTSERKTFSFKIGDPFIVVGERINPTGKKALQAQLKEQNFELIGKFTEEQEKAGASILDVNVGMSGVDEKDLMLKVIDEVTMQTSLPISIDTSPIEVLEAALRRYPGRALVNSISCEKEVMEPKLEIASKYGAMIMLLPLSDNGLPQNFEEKKENIDFLLSKTYEHGFKKEDIIIDGLVSTIGANPDSAAEFLESVNYIGSLGIVSTCGLSNISFGLPQRPFINAAFLTMAIQCGLNMAILNPSQDLLMNAAYSADLLLNKEGADIRYIERMNSHEFTVSTSEGKNTNDINKHEEIHDILFKDVLKGNRNDIVRDTKTVLDEGKKPEDILNKELLPAIDEVGKLFNDGKYFLPQLIASAEAMKMSIEILEPLLSVEVSEKNQPVVIMATVKGDIHDIGKNLVVMMLKNHGFKVYDLGKDVSKEQIIEAALNYNADIIGLSALMTTTMKEMKNVIEYAKLKNVNAKIMIGGAVVTKEYADEIGADGYSEDAAKAVDVAKSLLK